MNRMSSTCQRLYDIQPAAVVSEAGILVNVPAPDRFRLHKLVVAERRPAAWRAKADKDIAQAAELLDVMLESRPGDLLIAQDAADTMPSGGDGKRTIVAGAHNSQRGENRNE